MWAGFLRFAISEEGMRRQFTEETGIQIPKAPRSVIEAMIDKATGYDTDWIKPFVIWATETYWGDEEDTPSVFYEKFKEFPA